MTDYGGRGTFRSICLDRVAKQRGGKGLFLRSILSRIHVYIHGIRMVPVGLNAGNGGLVDEHGHLITYNKKD